MSKEAVDRILELTLADESFRLGLFADPRKACAPFDITETEFLELLGDVLRDSQPRPLSQPAS